MMQQTNIIRVQEGTESVPYVVLQRVSEFAQVVVTPPLRVIREMNRERNALLICEPIADAVWTEPSD